VAWLTNTSLCLDETKYNLLCAGVLVMLCLCEGGRMEEGYSLTGLPVARYRIERGCKY
jgi:hypothetical protein